MTDAYINVTEVCANKAGDSYLCPVTEVCAAMQGCRWVRVHLVKGLSNHSDLVALVGGLCKALEGGGLHHSLTEGHHRVSNLDLHLSVQLTQILQSVAPSSCPCDKAALPCGDTYDEACGLFLCLKGMVFPFSSNHYA